MKKNNSEYKYSRSDICKICCVTKYRFVYFLDELLDVEYEIGSKGEHLYNEKLLEEFKKFVEETKGE